MWCRCNDCLWMRAMLDVINDPEFNISEFLVLSEWLGVDTSDP